MSSSRPPFWARWFKKAKGPTAEAPPPSSPIRAPLPKPPVPKEDVSGQAKAMESLSAWGSPRGPGEEEALGLLRSFTGTRFEGAAVEALLGAKSGRPLTDPLARSAATLLAARGETQRALDLLAPYDGREALALRSDLAAELGEFATALALMERVLLQDFNYPGGKERHARLRGALGLAPPRSATFRDDTTRLVPHEGRVPFALEGEWGRGGTGTVFRGTDRDLQRPVAVKVYHTQERDEALLRNEARAAVALGGPGVIRVYDVDPQRGWLVLEAVPAGSLKDLVQRQAWTSLLPLNAWLLPLLQTLKRIHQRGWVHNDIKPANILLRSPRDPLLSDFALAQPVGVRCPGGSLGYMSPQRLAGRPSHVEDDLYGVGRVLEDVLSALKPHQPVVAAAYGPFVTACLAPDSPVCRNAESALALAQALPAF